MLLLIPRCHLVVPAMWFPMSRVLSGVPRSRTESKFSLLVARGNADTTHLDSQFHIGDLGMVTQTMLSRRVL